MKPAKKAATPYSSTVVVEQQRAKERKAKQDAPTVPTPPRRAAHLKRLLAQSPSTGANAQADRMLNALRCGPITSEEARQFLDVIHPAGRIMALRNQGYEIETRWVVQLSACGRPHRVGEWTMVTS